MTPLDLAQAVVLIMLVAWMVQMTREWEGKEEAPDANL